MGAEHLAWVRTVLGVDIAALIAGTDPATLRRRLAELGPSLQELRGLAPTVVAPLAATLRTLSTDLDAPDAPARVEALEDSVAEALRAARAAEAAAAAQRPLAGAHPARDEQLALIDPALQQLRAAVQTVLEPVLRARNDLAMVALQERRDRIANATGTRDLAAAALQGPDLQRDITDAIQAAHADATASARIAAHRTEAGKAVGEAGRVIGGLSKPDGLDGRLAGLQADPSTTASADTVETVARDWEAAARLLLADAEVAKKNELAAKWEAELPKRTADVQKALAANSPDRSRMEALWAAAVASADKGEHEAAFKMMAEFDSLAAKPAEPATRGGEVGRGKAGLTTEAEINSLLAEATTLRTVDLKAVTDAAAEFGDPRPPAWQVETDRIVAALNLDRGAGADAIRAAVTDAKKDIAVQAKVVAKMTADKKAWTDVWASYERARDSMQAHPAVTVAPVPADFDPIKLAATQAQGKTTTFDYEGAFNALKVELDKFPALVTLADRVAQFKKARAERNTDVTALPASEPNAQANDELTKAKACLTDADSKATARQFDEALELLARIPKHIEKIALVKSTAANYDYLHNEFDTKLAHWDSLDAKYKTHFADDLQTLRNMNTAAGAAATGNDYVKAEQILAQGAWLLNRTDQTEIDATTYGDWRADFDGEYAKVKAYYDDPSAQPGIEDFYLRIESDKVCIEARAAKKEFNAANGIIDAVWGMFPDQLVLAEQYRVYAGKKKPITDKIDEVRALNTTGTAAAELAAADKYLALATAQETAKDFTKAETALNSALASANAGKALLQAEKAMADLKAPAGTGAAAVQDRVNAYPAMRAEVTKLPGAASFNALLTTADDAKRQAGEKLRDPPDPAAAAGFMDTAEATLQDVLQKAARKPAYDAALLAAQTLASFTLRQLNVDPKKCIDAEIQKVREAIARARALVQAPGYDFGGAQKELADVQILGSRAQEKVAVFDSLRGDRQIIKNLITYVGGSTYQPALAPEKQRLEKIEADTDKELAAFNFAAAKKLIADGKALDGPYRQLCTDYTAVIAKRTSRYSAAQALDGHEICRIERDQQARFKLQIDKMIDVDHAFVPASQFLDQYGWVTTRGNEAKTHYGEYTAKRDALTGRLTPLKGSTHPGEPALVKDVDDTVARADAMAMRREYEQAKIELDPLDAKIKTFETELPKQKLYATAQEAAKTKIETLGTHPNAKLIAPLLESLRARFAQAEEMAKRSAYDDARAVMNTIPAGCDAATVTANGFTEFNALGAGGSPSTAELEEAARKVEAKVQALQSAPPEQQLPGKVVEAATRLKEARDKVATDAGAAAQLIREASAACSEAEIHQQQFAQMEQELAAALKLVDDFTGGSHPAKAFVAQQMAAIRATMVQARQTMTARGSTAASKVLVDATAEFRSAAALADRRKEYNALRETLEPTGGTSELRALEADPNRFAAAKDIPTLQAKLTEAAANADAQPPDFDKAMAALKAAQAAAAAGRLAVKMAANVAAPTKEEVAKVLAQPDGEKRLDEIVAMLDPKARGDLMKVATEVRFGCTLDVTDWGATPGADVQRLYNNLGKLPPKHALKNDHMLMIEADLNTAAGSDYLKRKMRIREGGGQTSSGYMMGAESSLGSPVPDECKPATDTVVQRFDWNTLHEVGHAVDDKYRFMASRAGDSNFGGWTAYGRDVRAVAEKLVAEFEYDLVYTQAKLAKEANPPLPDAQNGVKPDEWERRRIRLEAWIDNAWASKNPWETASAAALLKLKTGEIIHESQNGMWMGYDSAARSRGITGYQFRAPAEWFAELYAAYYTGKLKRSHPAAVWLSTLENATP